MQLIDRNTHVTITNIVTKICYWGRRGPPFTSGDFKRESFALEPRGYTGGMPDQLFCMNAFYTQLYLNI
jgi:hypothetical protein